MAEKIIRPQPGPQMNFLSNPSDIVIYGGAAGGGKTYSLLLEPLRHLGNPQFRGVIFRRTSPQIRNVGGLWDESGKIYGPLGLRSRDSTLDWSAPNGWHLKFSHMEHESDKFNWQGSQMAFLGFDEITHFSEGQFFYMLSRLRSTSGIMGYVRATCNPDPDSWVAQFLSWWIHQETGFPIKERAGVVRYFVRDGESIVWSDSSKTLTECYGEELKPKSVSFVPALASDNKILHRADPSYHSNLLALPQVERERLVKGNWKIRHSSGLIFKREWFKIFTVSPSPELGISVRFWDRAATPYDGSNDPDWTVGCKIRKFEDDTYLIEDVTRFRGTPAEVQHKILKTATHDGYQTQIILSQDPGQAGVSEIEHLKNVLKDFSVHKIKETGSKVTRSFGMSSAIEIGKVSLLHGKWNSVFIDELEAFPNGSHDDQVDSANGAFGFLSNLTQYSYRARRL